ncbi:RICIN domain-containing protein [Micromonospora sediminicola]|uniref:RICIN domain-containing protein n=1 Tax=Micromonospora sediminicola TaxID=946078 RepID=UPI0037AA0623
MIRNRVGGAVAASLLAAGLGAAALGQPAQAAGGHYQIVNYGSGKCLEVDRYGAPSSLGGLVVQRTCDGQAVQRWSPVGQSTYTFVNQSSGMCLDVRNGVNADGTPLQQWACTGTTSMKWTVSPNSFSGVHQVRSQIGGRCLDVRGGSSADGATVQIYHCTGFGNPAQVWSFVPA